MDPKVRGVGGHGHLGPPDTGGAKRSEVAQQGGIVHCAPIRQRTGRWPACFAASSIARWMVSASAPAIRVRLSNASPTDARPHDPARRDQVALANSHRGRLFFASSGRGNVCGQDVPHRPSGRQGSGNQLCLTDGGELVLFAADPAQFEVAGRTQACGVTWCSPAYADGRLYLRDAKTLFCLDLAPCAVD